MASGMEGSFPCLKTMPSTNPGGTVSKSEGGRGSGGGRGGGGTMAVSRSTLHTVYTHIQLINPIQYIMAYMAACTCRNDMRDEQIMWLDDYMYHYTYSNEIALARSKH